MREGLKSSIRLKEMVMTKRCLMTTCSALLAVSTGLAQETPVTKTADNGPSLEVTMIFIQEKIAQQGKINYAVYGHDSTNNSDWVKQLGSMRTWPIAWPRP
jgi:hypothetical protein